MAKGKGREGLTRIGELLPGFEHLIPPAANEAKALTVQGKHHYTQMKQILALTEIANDPNLDMGFMHRLLALCILPRTDPGDRLQYKRQNGPYKLIMIAGGDNRLPYGNLPRLLLAWVCTEIVRTQQRKLILGQSLAAFMRELGITSDSGGKNSDRTRLKKQMDRLFNCHIDMIYQPKGGPKAETGGRFAPKTVLWWDYRQPEQDTLWESWILIGQELFDEILAHPVPIHMAILKAMRRSSLGLDLYLWLSFKTYSLWMDEQRQIKKLMDAGRPIDALEKPKSELSWTQLYIQFGVDPSKADDKYVIRDFRKDALRELKKLKACWPALDFAVGTGCLEIRACAPSVPPKAIAR